MERSTSNLVILDTKEKIIDLLNKSKLPVTVMQYIIKDVKEIVDLNAENIIAKEKLQQKEGAKNEGNV